jgi:hypothetical protein
MRLSKVLKCDGGTEVAAMLNNASWQPEFPPWRSVWTYAAFGKSQVIHRFGL